MSQKKRSVTLSNTVYEWLEVLVSTGEYSDLNDAATYLLMQVKRGTHLNGSHLGAIEASTTPVLETPESPEAELSRLRSLKPMERMKNSVRIEQLKTLLES